MARLLLLFATHHAPSWAWPGITIFATLALCTLLVSLCASYYRRHRRRRLNAPTMFISDPTGTLATDNYSLEYWLSQATLELGGQGDYSREQRSQDLCLWKKGILMGGKCQLPEFSGVIIYDNSGNVMNSGTPRLTYPGW